MGQRVARSFGLRRKDELEAAALLRRGLELDPAPEGRRELVFPAGFHFAVESLCISGDPVCGQGWPPYEIGGQIIAAALCGLDKCAHMSYSGISASDGAEFLAKNAFRHTGGGG